MQEGSPDLRHGLRRKCYRGDSRGLSSRWTPRPSAGCGSAYFERLVRLARQRLSNAERRVADEEDVALSAFASFCSAAEAGRFPDLTDRHQLWRLLIKLTAQKAADQVRRQRRVKRGGGEVRGESALLQRDDSGIDEGLAQVVGDTPTPEFAAMVADQCARCSTASTTTCGRSRWPRWKTTRTRKSPPSCAAR